MLPKTGLGKEVRGGPALTLIWQVWAKKIEEEAQMARRGKAGLPIKSFLRDFYLRQYGVRSVAVKAVSDFFASLRQACHIRHERGLPY